MAALFCHYFLFKSYFMTNYTLPKRNARQRLACFLLLLSGMLVSFSGYATTYYVDAAAGNDNNNGTSEATAWRTLGKVNGFAFVAGDITRFKKGQSWSGQLVISRAGTSASVITFTSYGTGNKPLINADGRVRDAIFVANSASHIVVDGFAVTNFDGADIFDGAEARRTGIHVGQWADPPATMTNITILNNEVYYSEGCSNHPNVGSPRGTTLNPADNNQYQNAGIYVDPHNINGLTIQGNYIHDCTSMGILCAIYKAGSNVVIRSNSVYNVGSDGIVVWNTPNLLVELNAVIKAGNNSGTNPRGSGVSGFNGYAVCGIWSFYCNSPLFQYNYCEGTKLIRYDGQAWDFDIGVSGAGVYQYNYSRENEGGFNLGGLSSNDAGFIYRYNVSINDGPKQGGGTGQGFFNGASQFYNNIFYRNDGKVFHFDSYTKTTGTFKNNIFYSANSPAQTYVADGRVFSNNCFFGHTANSPGTAPVLSNPNFVDVSQAAKVPPGVILNSPADLRNYVSGFKLNTGSPCINAGTTVANGGLDFWGNTLYNGAPDIGANESSGTPPVIAYSARQTLSPITVDGNLSESVWGAGIDTSVNKAVIGSPNNNVTFSALWTPTHLYVAVRVLDGTLYRETGNIWDDDAVEVYIDAENNGGSYGANDRQYVKAYNTDTFSEINGNTSDVLQGWSLVSGGYTIELGIPWSRIGVSPSANLTIGFDIGVNDDDNGGTRDHQQMWRGDVNNWQSTANFGDLILSATTTGSGAGLPTPLVSLPLNENAGTNIMNSGSVGGTFIRTMPTPAWSTNALAGAGGASCLDFGTTTGNYVIESAANLAALQNLSAFTITGWINCRSNTVGPGGNRLVSWINNGGNGADLVYRSDGSVALSVNEWPDLVNGSSAGKITTNASAPSSNWVFVAVTYNGSQVQYYFGNSTTNATPDVTRTYDRGASGPNISRLAIGHFNIATRAGATDRMFRGLIDGVNIFGSVLSPGEIIEVQTAAGGSLARLDRPANETVVKKRDEPAVYPNPVSANSFKIELHTDRSAQVKISIIGALSQKTITLKRTVQQGSNMIDIPAANLKNGTYLITIEKGNERITKKVVIAR